ncbi:hypothetical protein E2562_013074 [Oryza meyeriana var. granulata]|uniref:Glutathione peroxidase n=2 Tax=Oryza TaxID=4527 RepID=A0A6G1DJ08_9ORYZ|nr:hypothetical protein E2562_013074 [Oryza meyeriana var. granulata]
MHPSPESVRSTARSDAAQGVAHRATYGSSSQHAAGAGPISTKLPFARRGGGGKGHSSCVGHTLRLQAFTPSGLALFIISPPAVTSRQSRPTPLQLSSSSPRYRLATTRFLRRPLDRRAGTLPSPSARSSMAAASSATSVHDFTVKDASGKDVDLSIYKGKVLLIVNVASQCGLTNSNYTELSQLYEKYKDQGFEILAFPCNQFGGQEPGSNEEIVQFACTRFKAEYPIFDKVDVNGNNAAPLYKYLKSNKGGLFGDSIKWNFSKFLVDKEGRVVDRYAPTTSPLSIEKDIKKLLGSS